MMEGMSLDGSAPLLRREFPAERREKLEAMTQEDRLARQRRKEKEMKKKIAGKAWAVRAVVGAMQRCCLLALLSAALGRGCVSGLGALPRGVELELCRSSRVPARGRNAHLVEWLLTNSAFA